jgi:glycosyltransferase involved in cell wall biosynthesis
VVVTVRPSPQETNDPALLKGLPEELVCYRTGWLSLATAAARVRGRLKQPAPENHPPPAAGSRQKHGWTDWLSWWLQVPDSRVGWLPAGVWSGFQAIHRHRCQAIYTTAPYWSAHLIGLVLRRLTGLPWLADFRDPWRANTHRVIPHRLPDRFDRWLERQVIRHAARVIGNTPSVRRDFIRRYPDCAERFVTIPNGYEPEHFRGLTPRRLTGPDRFALTHAGDFYGNRRPEPLFAALRLLRQRAPDAASRFALQLVGRTDYEGEPLTRIATRYGIDDLVLVHPPVPRRQALELMHGSDALLAVSFSGAGAHLQVPCKLYDYLGFSQPILALTPRASALAEMLRFAGRRAEICEPEDPQEVADALLRLQAEPLGAGAVAVRPELTRSFQAGQVADLLGAVVAGRVQRRRAAGRLPLGPLGGLAPWG